MSPDNASHQDIVTAVIVAHDAAAWLPRVTDALASQTRPVQRVVGVDTGSRDRSGAMLAQALGRGCVFGMDRTTGYGAAVAQALRHRAAHAHVPPVTAPREERTEWIWLLHDDSEPAPGALEQLLIAAARTPAAAVLGPKVKDWSDRDVLLETGITIDRAGRRVTGIEPREVDQGQHDGDRDAMAVSSAGMLIRRDVWDQVGGFDPGMRLFREDVDLCWRVHAAGHRVRVVTDAVVYHVESSARNRRETSAALHRRRQDRHNGLLVLLGNLPALPMLSALAGNAVLSTLRILFFLLAKRPRAALDEFSAYTSVALHPLRLLAARRARAPGRQTAYARLRADILPGRSLNKLAEFATSALSRSAPVDVVGSHHATEDPSEDDSMLVDNGLVQRILTHPGVLLFAALTVVALVAARPLLGRGPLGGGALLPAWGGASGLWQEYLQGFHPIGIGTTASAPPYVAVIAMLATVLGGKPWLAVDVMLIGCVPLAGVAAFWASRRITKFVPARLWAAAAYALLPVGMGAVASGRLGTAVILVLTPFAAVLAGYVYTRPKRRARRAAWATALVVAIAAAFVPVVWLAAAVVALAGLAATGRRRSGGLLNTAIIIVAPAALLLPWAADLAAHPARFFLEAGLQRAGLASPHLPARSLLLLSPGGPGLPPFWVTAGLAAAALVALVASRRRGPVVAGWGIAITGLLIGGAVSRVFVRPSGGSTAFPAWPGPALAIAGAGLIIAVAAAADPLAARLRRGRWHSARGLAVLVLGALACSVPVLAGVFWVLAGVKGPVAPAAGPVLPEFVSVSSQTGPRPRTLVLQAGPHGSVNFAVLRGSDPLLGSQEFAMPAPAQRALNQSVAELTAPRGGDLRDQGRTLASIGIGYVLMPAPVSASIAQVLDGVPGLRPVSQTDQLQLWRVADTTARVTVHEPDGTVVPVASGPVNVTGAAAPAAGGTLVLAEPAGGWHATLNGRPLVPLTSPVNGWEQGFRLPAGGGSLSISHNETGREVAVALEALAALVVAVLGLPGTRAAAEAEEKQAAQRRRGATGKERGPARPPGRRTRRGRPARAEPPGRAEPEVAAPAETERVPARAGVPAQAVPPAATDPGRRRGDFAPAAREVPEYPGTPLPREPSGYRGSRRATGDYDQTGTDSGFATPGYQPARPRPGQEPGAYRDAGGVAAPPPAARPGAGRPGPAMPPRRAAPARQDDPEQDYGPAGRPTPLPRRGRRGRPASEVPPGSPAGGTPRVPPAADTRDFRSAARPQGSPPAADTRDFRSAARPQGSPPAADTRDFRAAARPQGPPPAADTRDFRAAARPQGPPPAADTRDFRAARPQGPPPAADTRRFLRRQGVPSAAETRSFPPPAGTRGAQRFLPARGRGAPPPAEAPAARPTAGGRGTRASSGIRGGGLRGRLFGRGRGAGGDEQPGTVPPSGSPPGEHGALSPLPPLPPPSGRRSRPGGHERRAAPVPPEWGREPYRDQGDSDW